MVHNGLEEKKCKESAKLSNLKPKRVYKIIWLRTQKALQLGGWKQRTTKHKKIDRSIPNQVLLSLQSIALIFLPLQFSRRKLDKP